MSRAQKETAMQWICWKMKKKKKRWMRCWGGKKARNPKIQFRLRSGTVSSQDLGFQIIMKVKKLKSGTKKDEEERERETTFVRTHRLNCMQANLLPLSLCLSRH